MKPNVEQSGADRCDTLAAAFMSAAPPAGRLK